MIIYVSMRLSPTIFPCFLAWKPAAARTAAMRPDPCFDAIDKGVSFWSSSALTASWPCGIPVEQGVGMTCWDLKEKKHYMLESPVPLLSCFHHPSSTTIWCIYIICLYIFINISYVYIYICKYSYMLYVFDTFEISCVMVTQSPNLDLEHVTFFKDFACRVRSIAASKRVHSLVLTVPWHTGPTWQSNEVINTRKGSNPPKSRKLRQTLEFKMTSNRQALFQRSVLAETWQQHATAVLRWSLHWKKWSFWISMWSAYGILLESRLYHPQNKSCDFGTCMMSLNVWPPPRVVRKMWFRLDAMVQRIPHFLVLHETSEALPTLNITSYQLLYTSWKRVFTWVASIYSYKKSYISNIANGSGS